MPHSLVKKFTYGDERIDRRAKCFFENMLEKYSVTIQKIASNRNEQIGFHRLIKCKKFTVDKMIEEFSSHTQLLTQDVGHILCIHDTTELKFDVEFNKNIREGLGPLTKSFCKGFLLHPGLILDAESSTVLGLSDVKVWARKESETPKLKDNNGRTIKNKDYADLPIEKKRII